MALASIPSPRKLAPLSQGRWADFLEQQVIEDVPEPNAEEEEDANCLCVGDVSSEGSDAAPEPSKAEEVLGTVELAKTSPALEGRSGTHWQGALVEDESDEEEGATAASRRRRRGRQRQRCYTHAHLAWWSEPQARRQGSEP